MAFQVRAPLVVTKNEDGSALYLYAGAILPERVKGAELDRLVAEGFVVDLNPEPPAGTPLTAEELARAAEHEGFTGDRPDSPQSDTRPNEAGAGSSKEKWIAFAAFREVELDADASRDDIIAAVTAAGF